VKVDKVQISARIFIETRKNPTKLFDSSDETFDPIAFFIKRVIIIPLHHAIRFWRNDRDRTLTRKEGRHRIRIVGFI
jgi:hypothetical protein